jgi:ubiquitin-conjugating enzyme E2 S
MRNYSPVSIGFSYLLTHLVVIILNCWDRLMTSIHAMKPKPKSEKVAIAESTSVNASTTNSEVHTPLMHNSANKDNCLDSGFSLGATDAVAACNSPSAKKPKGELGSAKVFVDKKKMDVRKKSLKRL